MERREIILDVMLPFRLSNNNEGRTKAWYSAARERKEMESRLRLLGHTRQPFPHAVEVVVTRILGPSERLFDHSSLGRGNYKELEDALVACGWFVDDSPAYIPHTHFYQNQELRKLGPSIRIQIYK